MTDAHSRVNGVGRRECSRDGGGKFYLFIWNGTTGVRSNSLGVGTALMAVLATGVRGFQIECEYTNNRAFIVYSKGAVANPQFALAAEMPSAFLQRKTREKPLTTIIY